MLKVSLVVEILRSFPRFVFWLAALAQALLWIAVPAIFYATPPGNVPALLAIGHVYRADGIAPPLAFWLADAAFTLAGSHAIGVYVLSQICVIVAFCAIFTLGRATLGDRHAVLAILLMAGITALSVPTPDFGPAILAMPLWALALLHLWRAAGEGRLLYWYALAADLVLLLATSYLGFVFAALIAIFLATTDRGRASFARVEFRIAAALVCVAALAPLYWIYQGGAEYAAQALRLRAADAGWANTLAWLRASTILVLSHFGLAILVIVAGAIGWAPRGEAPAIERQPADSFARRMIYFFAFAPMAAATLLAALTGQAAALRPAPLVLVSGLAVVLTAGDSIRLHHQRVATIAWCGLLIAPAIITAFAVTVLPWILGIEFKVAQPSTQIGRFFAENFERRTSKPLALVGGDDSLALLVAIGARSRPAIVGEPLPGGIHTASPAQVAEKGAVLVWPATDAAGTPPASLRARYPDLVPEVPRAFERAMQGRLPLLRVGWAVIRPRAAQ